MFHYALQFVDDNGKHFAQPVSVGDGANVAAFFSELKGLVIAHPCKSKRAALEVAVAWNDEAKKNGNYRYDFV